MKTMTCNQLGGACDKAFHADTFEEIADMSKKHGTEMLKQRDEEHLKAMQAMKDLMVKPEAMMAWFEAKRKEFDSMPED